MRGGNNNMEQKHIKDMNGKSMDINGLQTIDSIHKKGDIKPIVKAKAPQHISNSQIQYLD